MWALDQALLLARVPTRLLPARLAVPQLMPPTAALWPPVLPLLVQALLELLLVQALLALLEPALLVRAKAILLPPQLPVRGQLLTPEPAPKSFILTTTVAR